MRSQSDKKMKDEIKTKQSRNKEQQIHRSGLPKPKASKDKAFSPSNLDLIKKRSKEISTSIKKKRNEERSVEKPSIFNN